ncbi:MAG: phosphopantetheine-binding protein [Candidatus Aminicenantes bacterium]|jgi:acyl carrier protein
MIKENEMYGKLSEILAEITGLETEEITGNSSLMEDLGIESFDIADLNFKISEVFGVENSNEFLSVEGIIGNNDFVDENNCLTPAGVEELKRRIPTLEIPEETKTQQIPLLDLMNKVTVNDLVKFILAQSSKN